MLHPEMNLNDYIAIKALNIYEIVKKSKQININEKTLRTAMSTGNFKNPDEYFDCLAFLYMFDFIDYKNGIVRIKTNEAR